jgi:hypothetical protein
MGVEGRACLIALCGERIRLELAFDTSALSVEKGIDGIRDAAGRRSLRWVEREAAHDERIEAARNARTSRARRRLEAGLAAPDDADDVAVVERLLARHDLVQHRAEREDIGSRDDLLAEHLLGRHISRAPSLHVVVLGALDVAPLDELRDAPVEDVHLAELAANDIVRLEIAVHDTARVRIGDGQADLAEHAQPLGERREQRLRRSLGQDLTQRASEDPSHRVLRLAGRRGAEVVDRHDAGVLELRARLGLRDEERGLEHAGAGKDALLRDGAAEHGVEDLVDASHAAATQLAEHREARRRRRGGRSLGSCRGVTRERIAPHRHAGVTPPGAYDVGRSHGGRSLGLRRAISVLVPHLRAMLASASLVGP